jgi:hypothetical protein
MIDFAVQIMHEMTESVAVVEHKESLVVAMLA